MKFLEIPAEKSVIPGIPAGNSWDGSFPGIPEHSRTGIPGGPARRPIVNRISRVCCVVGVGM